MTLPFFLGPVPPPVQWLLLTPDRISTKTDKSKLLHGLQSHIEPKLDWICSAVHNFDGKAIPQSIIAFPVTLKSLMEPVFNQELNEGHVRFVTDAYMQCISNSLKSPTNILTEENLDGLFNTVYATKDAPSECQQHWPEYGGRYLQSYTV